MKVVFGTLLLTFAVFLNSIRQFSSQMHNGNGNLNSALPRPENNLVTLPVRNEPEGILIRLPNGNYYISNGQGLIFTEYHNPTRIARVRQGNHVTLVHPPNFNHGGDNHFTSMIRPPSESRDRT